jgi:dipeptidase D
MNYPSHLPQIPEALWKYFHKINQIPRPSKHEDKMREFILKEAQFYHHPTVVDEVGNVIVYVKASPGYSEKPVVIIQNHMDMVTDHRPFKKINFYTDGIETQVVDDWMKAVDTTLGADNGIGCAAALALMSDPSISHPPLELLFTIDEETGLKGAWGVDGSKLKGKLMLNLDTEEWGSFYIGCAGGIDYEFKTSFKNQKNQDLNLKLKIEVTQFLGGHSGVDIHEQRGNALKFLIDILFSGLEKKYQINELRGGKAHNIIPRDASCVIMIPESDKDYWTTLIEKIQSNWKSFLPKSDQDFKVQFSFETCSNSLGLSGEELKRVLNFLQAFPHGAHKYDLNSNRELVSLSNNFAICYVMNEQVYLLSSLRFFDRKECISLENQVKSLSVLAGFEMSHHGEYPSWKPVRENPLLDHCLNVYEKTFHQKPKVTAIHAGLECGILREKIGRPIHAVSFGPTIMGAHSPDERVSIPTVASFWKLLKEILAQLPKESL